MPLLDVPVLLLQNDYSVHGEVLEHRLSMFRLDLFRESIQLSAFICCATLIARMASNVLVLSSIASEILESAPGENVVCAFAWTSHRQI